MLCLETERNFLEQGWVKAFFPSSRIRWKCVTQHHHWWLLFVGARMTDLLGRKLGICLYETCPDMGEEAGHGQSPVCPWLVPCSPLWIQKELSPNKYKGGCAWVSENVITWCGIPIVRCWLIFLCMESYFAALETSGCSRGRHWSTCMKCFSKEGFFP